MTHAGTPHGPGLGAGPRGRGARAAASRRARARATRAPGIPLDPEQLPTRALLAFADLLARYHRHRILHLERLERLLASGRPVLLVGNHALDIVDPLLLLAAVFRRTGCAPNFVGHEKGWFEIPLLREIAQRYQVIPSRRPEATLAALRRNRFLMLFPGANREAALRSYRDEPYRLQWARRTGFLRLALEAPAELVFVAAVGSDEAYYQSRLPLPRALLAWVNGGDAERYRSARLRFGLGGPHLLPGLFPLPVQLTHVVSEPLDLGDRARALRDPQAFAALHGSVWHRCQRFLDRAVARRGGDLLDLSVRAAEGLLQRLGA